MAPSWRQKWKELATRMSQAYLLANFNSVTSSIRGDVENVEQNCPCIVVRRGLFMAQLLIPVSGREQLKGLGLLDPTWLHGTRADPVS